MTTQTPAAAEIEKWHRIRVRFFIKFLLLIRVRKNVESCHGPLWQEYNQCIINKWIQQLV